MAKTEEGENVFKFPKRQSSLAAPSSPPKATSSSSAAAAAPTETIFQSAWSMFDSLFQDPVESLSDEENRLSYSLTAPVPRLRRNTRTSSSASTSQRRSSSSPTRQMASLLFTPPTIPSMPSIDNIFPFLKDEPLDPNHPPCEHRHPLGGIEGEVVFIPGLYGTNLHHKETDAKGWITMEMVWNLVHAEIGLPLGAEYGEDDDHSPARSETSYFSILEAVGPINICRDLIKEMRQLEICKTEVKFHCFGYDWRRELQHSSEGFEKFLEDIYRSNGNKPITVIAHSMGGLITLSTLNRRPELFKRCIFVGTPFGPVPLIVWALRRGAPLIPNPKLLGSSLHFLCRSSYVFLPRQGNACVVDDNGKDYEIDFFNLDSWRKYCLTPLLKAASDEQEKSDLLAYLDYALSSAKSFLESLKFRQDIEYPPLVVIRSDRWPTAVGFRASVVPFSQPATAAPPTPIPNASTTDSPKPDPSSLALYPARSTSLPSDSPPTMASVLQEHSKRVSDSLASLFYPTMLNRKTSQDLVARTPTLEESRQAALDEGRNLEMVQGAELQQSGSGETLENGSSKPLTASPTKNMNDASPTSDAASPNGTGNLHMHEFDIKLHFPLRFAPGDGVVASSSTDMPEGYRYAVVQSASNHASLPNDLKAIAQAFKVEMMAENSVGEKGKEEEGIKVEEKA
ncbi:hypothetical protein HDU97_005668 [Phlyctochytrium planicorne]|nr:hypothetical protein HDU97_005668 [Phlyctochytrium planicorne]